MIDHELSIGLQHLAVPIMHVPSINLATVRKHSTFFLKSSKRHKNYDQFYDLFDFDKKLSSLLKTR